MGPPEGKQKGKWEYATHGGEGQVMLFGGNIFDYEWTDAHESAVVMDPLYGQAHVFRVYRATVEGTEQVFAAGEFSNSVWGFYVRGKE